MLVIGQCDGTVKGTVNPSCVSGQKASHAHAVVLHISLITFVSFFVKTYN